MKNKAIKMNEEITKVGQIYEFTGESTCFTNGKRYQVDSTYFDNAKQEHLTNFIDDYNDKHPWDNKHLLANFKLCKQ